MIGVTKRAKEVLKGILSEKVDNPQAGLRLITSGQRDQFALSIDVEMPGDHVVEHKGSKVLLVEEGLATRFTGTTLDIEDTPEGPMLVLFQES